MSLYVFHGLDNPGSEQVRVANRTAHLAHLDALGDQLVLAGPLLSDDGATMIGSLLVLDFPDGESAAAWTAQDPYAKAGLFASTTLHPFRKARPVTK